MSLADLIFLALVVGLPIVLAIRLFQVEPHGRPFLVTYALAVIGSSIFFVVAAALLMVTGIGGLDPFDGIFEAAFAVPAAFVIGLVIRINRHRKFVRSNASN